MAALFFLLINYPNQFQQRMDEYMTRLSQQFKRGKELEESIMKQMGGLKYDENH